MKKIRVSGHCPEGFLGMCRKMMGIMLISMMLTLTGCGNAFDHMPDLTEEESALIAEYAAGILLKHDKNLKMLASDYEIQAYDEREAILRENTEELLAAKKPEEEEAGQESGEEAAGAEATADPQLAQAAFPGIAQYCGVEGFQIDYAGYTVCDSYPEVESEDMVFAMDATPGNKLLVLSFSVRNNTSMDQELDMIDRDPQFRIAINEEGGRNTLPTLLLNDLSSYKDVVPAGSSVTLVLVREVTEAEAGGISTLSLSLQNGSGSASTVLE